jgi:predicted  nucleic acid-binding Zn-ribbon protein
VLLITNSNKEKLKFVDNCINPIVKINVYGEYTLSFTVPADTDYLQYVNIDNLCLCDGQYFNIGKYKVYRNLNSRLIDVYCEHISYEELMKDNDLIYNMNAGKDRTTTFSLAEGLRRVCASTNMNFTLDHDSSYNFIVKSEATKRKVLMQLMQAYGKQIKFDNYKIIVSDKLSDYNGVDFRIGKNIQEISKTVDKTTKDSQGNPAYAYELNVVDLSDFYNWDKAGIWDEVKVIDTELGIKFKGIIVEIEYNPVTKKNTKVSINNTIGSLADYEADIEDKIEDNANNIDDTNTKLDDTTKDINDKIDKTNDDLSLKIDKTNEALTITAQDLRNKDDQLTSKIEITAQQLSSDYNQKITSANGRITEANSRITQTAQQITMEVNSKISDVNGRIDSANSRITQTANQITMEVNQKITDVNGKVDAANSKITQTAEQITTEVNKQVTDINGKIDAANSNISQTAEQITTEVNKQFTDVDNKITETNSKIEQTASEIKSTVSSMSDDVGKIQSTIDQQADKISMVVSSDGDIKAASIAMAIADDGSAINMIADHISITPKSGVINFPDGQSLDCRNDAVRLRYSSSNYVRIDDDGISLYDGGSYCFAFKSDGMYYRGRKVKLTFE